MEPDTTLEALRFHLMEKTRILPKRQKLLGAKRPLDDDDKTVAECQLTSKSKLQLIGTPEENVFVYDENLEEALDDDFDTATIPLDEDPVNLAKLQTRINTVEVEELHPQQHERLLVLDVDYTLYDHRSAAESMAELQRPYLHDFLERANKYYDIVLWSATGMKWVHLKARQMGLLDSSRFKIRFLLSERPMITVEAPQKGGKLRVVRVKPLSFIWKRFPSYTPEKTIMFDDVKHNFLLNMWNGLVIAPFRNGPLHQETDTELLRLGQFLEIVRDENFTELDLRHWDRYFK